MPFENYFYTGSCRYHGVFTKHFPPRLHTTAEILRFFENIHCISIDPDNPNTNLIYGGCLDTAVLGPTNDFIADPFRYYSGCRVAVIEISSRLNLIYAGTQLNYFYSGYYGINTAQMQLAEQSMADIRGDLIKIKARVEVLAGMELVVITPLSLPVMFNGKFVIKKARHKFVQDLVEICHSENIKVVNPGGLFENCYPGINFESVMPDGKHYNTQQYPALVGACISEITGY